MRTVARNERPASPTAASAPSSSAAPTRSSAADHPVRPARIMPATLDVRRWSTPPRSVARREHVCRQAGRRADMLAGCARRRQPMVIDDARQCRPSCWTPTRRGLRPMSRKAAHGPERGARSSAPQGETGSPTALAAIARLAAAAARGGRQRLQRAHYDPLLFLVARPRASTGTPSSSCWKPSLEGRRRAPC